MKVTFIIGGAARTIEFDGASLPYQHHGLRGSLLDVALNFGVPLEHVCGGNCACTTCHVIVRSGMEHLSGMADNEADRLDTAWDLRPESRLACQAIVTGDVVCEVPAYTRNYVHEDGRIQLGTAGSGRGDSGSGLQALGSGACIGSRPALGPRPDKP